MIPHKYLFLVYTLRNKNVKTITTRKNKQPTFWQKYLMFHKAPITKFYVNLVCIIWYHHFNPYTSISVPLSSFLPYKFDHVTRQLLLYNPYISKDVPGTFDYYCWLLLLLLGWFGPPKPPREYAPVTLLRFIVLMTWLWRQNRMICRRRKRTKRMRGDRLCFFSFYFTAKFIFMGKYLAAFNAFLVFFFFYFADFHMFIPRNTFHRCYWEQNRTTWSVGGNHHHFSCFLFHLRNPKGNTSDFLLFFSFVRFCLCLPSS